MQHALPEQVEPGAAEHLPLDQLETVDVPLHRSVAPGFRDSGAHRRVVLPQTGGEAAQASFLGSFQPSVESRGFPSPHQAGEGADVLRCRPDRRNLGEQRVDEAARHQARGDDVGRAFDAEDASGEKVEQLAADALPKRPSPLGLHAEHEVCVFGAELGVESFEPFRLFFEVVVQGEDERPARERQRLLLLLRTWLPGYSRLSQARREAVLRLWRDSPVPVLRTGFQALRKAALAFAYLLPGRW